METLTVGSAVGRSLSYFLLLEVNYHLNLDRNKFKEEEKQNFQNKPNQPEKYDFIVVGGGTAGCIVANRLSENFHVLLLEAGGPAPSLAENPGFRSATGAKEINFIYKTQKLKHVSNKTLPVSQGKMLGGSFAHNGLLYHYGNSRDYDNWAKLTRDKSWKFSNVVKTYQKLENYTGPFPNQRGVGGPIQISTDNGDILKKFKMAAKELGYYYGSANGHQMEGVSPKEFTGKDGVASTTCSELIEPILGIRPTLTVRMYSEATKILFSKKSANGVLYRRHGKEFTAHASKEVIISAGTFGSPLLLMKSGIGPSEMLSKAKIKKMFDLPVGKNLQDHPSIRVHVEYQLDTAESGRGGLGPDFFVVSDTAKTAGEGEWPDVKMEEWPEFQTEKVLRGSVDGAKETHQALLVFLLGRSKSLGVVKLDAEKYLKGERENTELAIIDYNLFQDPTDKTRYIQGIKKALGIYKTKTFGPFGVRILPDGICGGSNKVGSDGYWSCVIETSTTVATHPMGTCRMGYGRKDKNSVVDSSFRVLGVKRLRVADASVLPKITNANINGPTMMMGEMAAYKILSKHRPTAAKNKRSNRKMRKF